MKKFLLTFVALLTTISLAACSSKTKEEKVVDDTNKQVEEAKKQVDEASKQAKEATESGKKVADEATKNVQKAG